MTLSADEFIGRFLLHVLPSGFHRIRHYGLHRRRDAASGQHRARSDNCSPRPRMRPSARTPRPPTVRPKIPVSPARRCPCCGGRMIIVEDVRRAAPLAFRRRRAGSGSTAHDRRPAFRFAPSIPPSPPAARRNTSATPARGRQSISLRPSPTPRSRASSQSKTACRCPAPAENTERRPIPPTPRLASRPRSSNPHWRARQTVLPTSPAVSSLGGFRSAGPGVTPNQSQGPAPETLSPPKRAFPSPRQRQECPRKRPKALREPCARSGRSPDDDSGAEGFPQRSEIRVELSRARSFGRAGRDGRRSAARVRLQPPEARGPSRSPSPARPERRL